MLSRFLNCPCETHWNATKIILRYIKGTSQFGNVLGKNGNFMLNFFSDADYACDTNEMKSTTSYAFTLGSEVISWESKNKLLVALSTT
jgi:hypothetical protein